MKPAKFKISLCCLTMLLLLCDDVFSQFDINDRNMVNLVSSTKDWMSGFKITMPTYNSCAYTLHYGGQDMFFVNASGYCWSKRGYYADADISSRTNLKNIDNSINLLKELKCYQYTTSNLDLITEKQATEASYNLRFGLIAQEVENIIPGIVVTLPDSSKAISYNDLIPIIIEVVKNQQYEIDTLTKIVKASEAARSPYLFQTAQGNYDKKNYINYYIQNNQNAEILIYNSDNELVKSYLLDKDSGKITIKAKELSVGTYYYSLIIDGKIFDSKQLILK